MIFNEAILVQNYMRLQTFRKKTRPIFIGVILTALFLALTWNSTFKYFTALPRLNYILYDISLKLFHSTKQSNTVVIVAIDEKSILAEGKWPWHRDKLATLVNNLKADNAAVVAFDIIFSEADSNVASSLLNYTKQQPNVSPIITDYLEASIPFLDNDKIFANSLQQLDTVLGVFFSNEKYISLGKLGVSPIAFKAAPNLIVSKMQSYTSAISALVDAAKYTGFVTTIPDEDGVLRRSPLVIEYNDILYPSLALEAARLYFLSDKINLDVGNVNGNEAILGVKLSNIYIPTEPNGNIINMYLGPAHTFTYYSATDVIHKKFPPQTFNGKIVFLGASALGIGDVHAIPLQLAAYPGTEVHATIAESILSKNFLSSPSWMTGIERIFVVVVGLIFSIAAAFSSILGLLALIVGGGLFVFAVQAYFWMHLHLVFPHIIVPYLMVLLIGIANADYGYFFESRYRRKLHDIYGEYVSTTYIDRMLENPKQFTLSGREKEMSVLFADVRGFTSISEKLDSNGVKTFLNALFTPLTEIIFTQQGTIDKYVGDMIVAFWNDPLDDAKHPYHAVIASLNMIAKVKEMAPVFAAQGVPEVRIGVGVNTGLMHVGDMGSKYRKAYTVVGNAVNLASRLEEANKFYDTTILVTEDTKNKCQGLIFRFIDYVKVKGKNIPIKIYQPLCLESEITVALKEELDLYNAALQDYYAQKWQNAKIKFTQLHALYPAIQIYSVYLARIETFSATPPSEPWDGSYVLLEK